MTKDPKSDEIPEKIRNQLTPGSRFETGTGGIIEFRKTKSGPEPDGRITHVAVFDVVEPDDAGFVFGPTYTTTEFLALCEIESGDLKAVN